MAEAKKAPVKDVEVVEEHRPPTLSELLMELQDAHEAHNVLDKDKVLALLAAIVKELE